MNHVFLDTVGMIAVWDETDQWHAAAHDAYQTLMVARAQVGRRLLRELVPPYVMCKL